MQTTPLKCVDDIEDYYHNVKDSSHFCHHQLTFKCLILLRFKENTVSRRQFWKSNTKNTAGTQALCLYAQFTNFKMTSSIKSL